MLTDKNYYGRAFDTELRRFGVTQLRPAREGDPAAAAGSSSCPLRQTIETTTPAPIKRSLPAYDH